MRYAYLTASLMALAGIGACSSEKETAHAPPGLDLKQHPDASADAESSDAGTTDGGSDTDAARGTGQVGDRCTVNFDCAVGYWCEKPDGACNGPGKCAFPPQYEIWQGLNLTCGCDGHTYTAPNDARHEMVNIASGGKCPSAQRCSSNANCFCLRDVNCDGPGTCVVPPINLCPQFTGLRCGCRGTVASQCSILTGSENVDGSRLAPECEPWPSPNAHSAP